eukprot:TRINITY_DN4160_c0_g1_i1.p1 TRINITY_DN4160_c0_g1~~TRINITY_DN4160_c0_g1_i1.p1  ORF type:complete len:233 (-),score=15.29 TRINITY_DN4160_c0_g1_i1:144-842(-)
MDSEKEEGPAQEAIRVIAQCLSFPSSDLFFCLPKNYGVPHILLAFYAWVPYVILFGFGIHFLLRRTSLSFFLCGLMAGIGVLNEGILKQLIKQPRPIETCACGYGMPSGHAAVTTGLFVWIALELWLNNWTTKSILGGESSTKLSRMLLLAAFLLPTSYSRVFFYYHTWQQVVVGSLVGVVCATIYFVLLSFVFADYLDAIFLFPPLSWFKIQNHYPKRPQDFYDDHLVKLV